MEVFQREAEPLVEEAGGNFVRVPPSGDLLTQLGLGSCAREVLNARGAQRNGLIGSSAVAALARLRGQRGEVRVAVDEQRRVADDLEHVDPSV